MQMGSRSAFRKRSADLERKKNLPVLAHEEARSLLMLEHQVGTL